MMGQRVSITARSDQAMACLSIIGDNVPSCIQSRIDILTELLSLTATNTHTHAGIRSISFTVSQLYKKV